MTGSTRPTLRVVHLLDGRHFGGAEQMVRRLALASPRVGVEARVYALSAGRLADDLQEAGLRPRLFRSAGRFDLRFLGAMRGALADDRAQIIQAHTSRTHLIARLLSRRTGLPNITTIQSSIALDENRGRRSHPLRARIERLGRRWTNKICPVSREEADRIVREERAPAAKVLCIPNGVEDAGPPAGEARSTELGDWLAAEGLPADAFVIAMIAQMRPRKGPETLLRAFARFLGSGGEGVLLMIGDDTFTEGAGYLAQLRRLAGMLNLQDRTRFTGFMPDPWRLARHAGLIVLPSLFGEGLPLTLLEAMNHARPIAASDAPGNRECVVGERTGWLHAPGDDAELARHLQAAALDRDDARRRGLEGRQLFLDRFEMNRVLEAWRALYEELAKG